MKILVSPLVLCAALPGVAFADDSTPVANPDASPFVTMFHQDGTSHVDVDASYMFAKSDGDATPTVLRLDLFGQYIHPASGFGVYGTVPFTHASEGDVSNDELGGLEIGAIYVPRLDSPYASVVVHAGLALPTVSDGDNAGFANLASGAMRLSELYASLPKSTTLRLGISPMVHSGAVFARFDAGLDINLDAPNDADLKPAYEINAGIGVHVDKATIEAEFANLTLTGDNGGSLDTIGVSAQYDAGKVAPYAAVIVGLDDDVRDIMNAAVVVGMRARP